MEFMESTTFVPDFLVHWESIDWNKERMGMISILSMLSYKGSPPFRIPFKESL